MSNNLKVLHDSDTNIVKISDQLRGGERMKVSHSDLKNNGEYNNNGSMRPQLNENNSPTKHARPNFSMLENDLNLLANPKKTKQFSSSSEEESEDSEDVSTEAGEDDGMGMAHDHNTLLGNVDDDDDDDDESAGNGGGNTFNPFSMHNSNNSDDEDDDEETGSDENTGTSVSRRPPERPKTLEEIAAEKQELLYRLDRLKENGFKPSREYTMKNSLEDIKFEYERLKKQRDINKSIKFQRKILMAITSGIEFINGKFDPLDIKLDGWSESIYENLHEYDEVFEELHEKYQSKMKVPPELRLLMMVGGSAVMFHLSNSLFKSKMPGLDQILQQNPELARNVQQAAMNTMKTEQAASGENDPLFNMMMNQAENMMGPKPAAGKGQMKGPSGVDDILNMVNGPRVPPVKNEDTVSSVSTNQSGTMRRIRMKKKDGSKGRVIDLA